MAEITNNGKWKKEGAKYKTNDYLYAEDINKMINLFESFIVFDSEGNFTGIKIPETGLNLYSGETRWVLTVDGNGILQTEQK